MEVFDKDGNPVDGVFSQEELDAKIAELTKAPEPAAPVAPIAPAAPVVPPAPTVDPLVTQLKEQLDNLTKSFEMTVTTKYGTGMTPEQKAAFDAKFTELSSLPTYADTTPAGLEKRAEAAYTLATGQPFQYNAMNMQNLGASGGKAPTVANNELKEEDKPIAAALGNTPEDYKKYGTPSA